MGAPKQNTQRIRRNEMTGHGNADSQISSHIGQNTHHRKFGNPQPNVPNANAIRLFFIQNFTLYLLPFTLLLFAAYLFWLQGTNLSG